MRAMRARGRLQQVLSRLAPEGGWLRAINCDGRWGAGLLGACMLLLGLQLGGEGALERLRYDRGAIAAGEWWRLLTAHFVHLDLRHAVVNIAGVVLLWTLLAREFRPQQWALILLGAIAAIDCGLWLQRPIASWYAGASGMLHGVLAAGAFALLRRRDPEGWAVAAVLAAKLTYEQRVGPLPFVGRALPVLDEAHLYGALGGLAAAALCAGLTSPTSRETALRSRDKPAGPRAG